MISIGEWLFDPSARRLWRAGREARLSPKAASVLQALAETPNQVWSRDALLERVWAGTTVGEEVLTHAIAEIRRALQDDFRRPNHLETLHKAGYRLLCGRAANRGDVSTTQMSGRFDLNAYASYLQASELSDRGGRANTLLAISLYASAIRSDRTFAPAHVGLAKALMFLDYDHPTEVGDALDHCVMAQRLKPDYAEAYAVEGLVAAIAGDFDRSSRSFKTAIALHPDSPETLYLFSRVCMAIVDLEPAAVMLERCTSVRPVEFDAPVLAGKVRRMLGDELAARSNFQRAVSRVEARLSAFPDDFRALTDKARCLWSLGRLDEARAVTERVAAHPEPMSYQLACVLASAGLAERALDVLEAAADSGWRYRGWLDRDPDFDGLRNAPRFHRICASMHRT